MRRLHGLSMVMALVLMLFGFYYGSQVRQFSNSMSVKYDSDGLTAAQIDQINQGLEEETEEELPYVTGYLKQKDVVVENESLGRSMSLTVVGVYGEMSEVFKAPLSLGSFVQKADETGCVISITAAEHLFGDKYVVGCTLMVKGEPYVVRGVLKEEEAILLLQEKGSGKFSCLELLYERDDYPASNAKALLLRLGLPDYDSFTECNLYGGIAGIFMGLPFLALLCFLAKKIDRKLMRGKNWILIITFCLCSYLIARGFISFSDDYIPSRISDFQFWPDLIGRIRADYQKVLQYPMWGKDGEILNNLKSCITASLLSVILLLNKFVKIN